MTTISSVEVLVGERRLEVMLDEKRAPGLASALRRSVPHDTLAVHVQTAGDEFCVPVPFFHWYENRRKPEPGDVGYASFGNYLCFYYGSMAEQDGPTNVVGHIASNSQDVVELGRELLRSGAKMARVMGAEPPVPGAVHPSPLTQHAFAQTCRALRESALKEVPSDILQLRKMELPAMGNVAGRMQSCGLLLAVSEVFMTSRTLILEQESDLALLVKCLAVQLSRYGRWLAMAGMPETARHLSRLEQTLGEPTSAAVIVPALEDALLAFGRLRFWAEAISPWHSLAGGFTDDSGWVDVSILRRLNENEDE